MTPQISDLMKDPLLWINWGSGALALIILFMNRNTFNKLDDSKEYFLHFWFVMLVVFGFGYVSKIAGDVQIAKLIEAQKETGK